MRNFVYGVLGAFLGIAIYLVVSPQYSDYRAKAETERWIYELEPLQNRLAESYQKSGKFDVALTSQTALQLAEKPTVYKSGTIVMQGGYAGQVLLMTPSVTNGKVQWHCWVGPKSAMPKACRP